MLQALATLYKALGFDGHDIVTDIENDYLTENTCRNSRDVLWYMDSEICKAIYIDTCVFLTDDEIENELC